MSDTAKRIEEIRQELGKDLLILGHHYQRQSVLKHVDETGDSLELSRRAGENTTAKKVVFCGVKFMAESADMLTGPNQTVYMPETNAGCPMANMATTEQMRAAWDRLNSVVGDWIPVVYVNSSAEIKGCCGELGGSTCTSSNSRKVFEWAFAQGKKILFLPDEHLAANTARDIGIPDDEVAVYDPSKADGGLSDEVVAKARVIAWKGFCIVHQAFTVDQIKTVREMRPDAKIIIHPEAPKEVVALCDAHGSTSQIIDYVEKASEGSCVVVGTEVNLVEKLALKHRGRVEVKALTPSVCANMARTNPDNLLITLSEWPEAAIISVANDIRENARVALERMLSV
jgi:quinolinate synthase